MLRLLPLLLPLGIFLFAGQRGIDFGQHWDEVLRERDALHAVQTEVLLPAEYKYPSMCFWLSMLALAPEAISGAELNLKARRTYLQELAREVTSRDQRLRRRSLFLALSSLSLLWVYLLVLRWRGRPAEACLAACLLAFSWEFGYHARWVAPDVIMAQFGSLCLLALFALCDAKRPQAPLVLAAVAAGLATGTKYTAGLLLLAVLAMAWRAAKPAGTRGALVSCAKLLSIFALVFVVTTPGALLQPLVFLRDLRYEARHYSIGHYGFTVEAGWQHLSQILRYLTSSGPSASVWIAWPLSLVGLLGVFVTWRTARTEALLLTVVPALFIAYMSCQQVLFVRNLLFVMPCAAILSARGIASLWDRANSGKLRGALVALTGAALAANALWILGAAESVAQGHDSPRFAQELQTAIEAAAPETFYLSPMAQEALAKIPGAAPENTTTRAVPPSDFVVLIPEELRLVGSWPSNLPGRVERIFGPREVNFDYYSTWLEPHLVVLSWETARELESLEGRPGEVGLFGSGESGAFDPGKK